MKVVSPYSRTRNKQVVRIIGIIAALQYSYWTPSGLARRFGVSARTIRRDVAAISHGRVHLRHDGMQQAWTLKQAKCLVQTKRRA